VALKTLGQGNGPEEPLGKAQEGSRKSGAISTVSSRAGGPSRRGDNSSPPRPATSSIMVLWWRVRPWTPPR